jgi:hypothetical protein
VAPAPLDGPLRTFRTGRRLDLAANPFLYDHVIGGQPVLAAVFGVSWMGNVCEQLCPGYTFFRVEDYKVLKGIVFDETLADSYTLDLTETARSDDEIVFDALIHSTTHDGRQRYHYRSRGITLRRHIPAAPRYTSFDLEARETIDGTTLYSDGTLFHGPSFQGVEQVLNVNEQRVTTRCRAPVLPIEQQGQFPIQTLNPFLTDIQFQCMLVWVRRYHQAGGMPLGASRVENYRRIMPGEQFFVSMEVQESSPSKLLARVIAHDEQGYIYMQVTGTDITISTRLNALFAQSRVEMVRQGASQ